MTNVTRDSIPPASSACLTAETLSALAAGSLSARERHDALTHMARCGDCREIFVDLIELAGDVSLSAAPSSAMAAQSRVSQRKPSSWQWYAGAAAAAVIVAAGWSSFQFINNPDHQIQRAVSTLARSVQSERSTEARMAGEFEWGPAPVTMRGSANMNAALPVQEAVLAIRKLAERHRTARALDALGVANLVSGDIDAALRALDDAVAADASDINARIDLTAARLERWRRSRATIDATSAVDAAQRALILAPNDPLARFNRALAIESLGVASAAIDGWKDYLAVDSASKWAEEARQHLAQLERGGDSAAALPSPSSWTDAQLLDAAAQQPAVLERFLSDSWLPRWRENPDIVVRDAEFNHSAARVSAALVAAKRDRYLPDVVRAALTLSSAGSAAAKRRGCLVDGTAAISSSLAASGQSKMAEAESEARRAHAAFACAGFPTIESDALIGWALFSQDRRMEGVAAMQSMSPAAEAAGYVRGLGRQHYTQGLAALHAGKYSTADDEYVRALEMFDRAGERGLASSMWSQRAEVAGDEGDTARVWSCLSNAFALLPSLTTRQRHIVLVTASLQAGKEDLLGTSAFFADALVANAAQATDPAIPFGGYLQSAKARFAFGQHAAALDALSHARAVFPRMSDATMRSQYSIEVSELEGRILAATDPTKAIESFTSAMNGFGSSGRENRRARIFLDRGRAYRASGNAAAAESDWLTGIGLFEDQRPAIRDAQLHISHQDQLWDLFRELIAARAADPIGSLDVAERFRARALLDAMSSTRQLTPLSGTALYEWLPADVTAITYAILPDRLLRWTVTKHGVRVDEEPIAAAALAELVNECRSAWLKQTDAALANNPSIARLARLLLPNDLAPKTTTRVAFLPDGALFDVPFAALPQTNARLIVDDFVTSVAPSLTILKLGAHIDSRTAKHALLIASGEAHPDDHLPALPGATTEIHAITPLYPSRTVLEGSAITQSAMLGGLAHADVIHFAGHAITDAVSPSRSRLLLSPASTPSTVSFDDLRSATLRPSAVVVLSACDAARGRVFRSEGVVGLTYPFLANGAASVVAAIWPEADTVPPILWQHFHARLLAGVAPDAALAESQRLIRHNGSNTAVWAAFESVGGLVHQ